MNFYQRSVNFFSRNVVLNSFAHAIGGFGLAIVLQYYIQGEAFLSVLVGWLFVAISAGIHIWSIYGE